MLEPLQLGPVNPKHEILKSLMWDMGYAIWARTQEFAGGIYLTSQISHPHLEKAIAIAAWPRPQDIVSHSGMNSHENGSGAWSGLGS